MWECFLEVEGHLFNDSCSPALFGSLEDEVASELPVEEELLGIDYRRLPSRLGNAQASLDIALAAPSVDLDSCFDLC